MRRPKVLTIEVPNNLKSEGFACAASVAVFNALRTYYRDDVKAICNFTGLSKTRVYALMRQAPIKEAVVGESVQEIPPELRRWKMKKQMGEKECWDKWRDIHPEIKAMGEEARIAINAKYNAVKEAARIPGEYGHYLTVSELYYVKRHFINEYKKEQELLQ